MKNIDLNKTFIREFVQKNFDPRKVPETETEYKSLLARDVSTKETLEMFLRHWSELSAVIDESGSLAYVKMTLDTKNQEAEREYFHIVENISPVCEIYEDKLKDKFLSSPAIGSLDKGYYSLFIKQVKSQKEIFREENIELFVEDSRLCQNYQKISGGWMVEFENKKYTVQGMAVFLENQDRDIRERSYHARVGVHMQDADKLNDLYDEMLVVRKRIAHNAGFSNYRDYMFAAKERFDYTPDDCIRFHDAIAETIVPLLNDWMSRKAKKLNIQSVRPWDISVDPDGFGAVHAFENESELCEKVGKVFSALDKSTSAYFEFMRENKLLDLSSREGKAPGGYMTELGERRVPFIFMNAVGLKRDVDTLLHESGHSFHAFQAREQILKSYRSSPLEFAEVASMSMELLGRPYFQNVYKPEDVNRVRKDQLIKIVEFFPFMSMIDSFQHWVYTTDRNGREERGKKWQELNRRFQPFLDMSGLEEIEKTRWQYPHIYTVPFYYIEYGIAQMGALQVWRNSLKNEPKAVKDYLFALSLGGSRSLPELFLAAGAKFSMDKNTLSDLVGLIRDQVGE